MLVLVVDTSSAAVTAALVRVDDRIADERVADDPAVEVLAARVTVDSRAHGERLAPSIAECLRSTGQTAGDVSAVVGGVGPGPFTGLRVGLVTASVFADALGVPTYGVCSLDGIGAMVSAPRGVAPGRVLVAGDARRREVYWAVYVDGTRQGEPAVGKPADVATAAAGCAVMAGAGARLYADRLGLPLVNWDYPSPVALVGAALDRLRRRAPAEPLTPLYLRRPDAVEPAPRPVGDR